MSKRKKMTAAERTAFAARMKAARAAKDKPAAAPRPRPSATKKRPAQKRSPATKRPARKATTALITTTTRTTSVRRNPGPRASLLRNPLAGGAKGLLADAAGILTAFKVEGKDDSVVYMAGTVFAGAAATAVAGAFAVPLISRALPPIQSPMVARLANAGVYAGVGIVPALFVGNARIRRRLMAGAVGTTLAELIAPGCTSDLLRNTPLGKLIPDAGTPATPAAQAKVLQGLADDLERIPAQPASSGALGITDAPLDDRPGAMGGAEDDGSEAEFEDDGLGELVAAAADDRPGSL